MTKTQSKIVQSAIEIVSEEGIDKASLRKIADRAGVCKSLWYEYYHTKDDLIIDCLSSAIDTLEEKLTNYAKESNCKHLFDAIHGAIQSFAEEDKTLITFIARYQQYYTTEKNIEMNNLYRRRIDRLAARLAQINNDVPSNVSITSVWDDAIHQVVLSEIDIAQQ